MRRPASTFAVIVALGLTLSAQAPQRIVLKVKSSQPSADGKSTVVTLESGSTLTIPATDVDSGMTTAVAEAMGKTTAPPSGTSAGVPTQSEALSGIRAKCAKEWPDDFNMRAFCEKQQNESITALRARSMTSADQVTIRNKCGKEWAGDFHMRDFCEKQQLEALRKIGR